MIIKSVGEYLQNVENVYRDLSGNETVNLWFRGHESSSYELIPSLYRKDKIDVGRNIDPACERELIRDFKLNAESLLDHVPKNDFEWLFIMQHYGMPTRLLDWTENSLAALYFSVADLNTSVDGEVWVLKPFTLNITTIKHKSVPVSDHDKLQNYILDNSRGKVKREITGKYPVALRPSRRSRRIIAQRGMFTIHGNIKKPLNKMDIEKLVLKSMKIDRHSKLDIVRQLYRAGVTRYSIYPEIENLSAELKFRYSENYYI